MQSVKDFEAVDFRSLYAFDSLNAIIANAGSPASILKTVDGGKTWKEVYHNEHKDIFLDGIDFWDSQRGLIYGDPINSHMQILKTSDGGNTWDVNLDPPCDTCVGGPIIVWISKTTGRATGLLVMQ